MTVKTQKQGVLYISANDELLREAVISGRSVAKHNPNIRIGLVTDEPPDKDIFDDVFESKLEGGFSDKPLHMQLPYEKTIYLDTDTLINGSLSPIFDTLNRFGIAATHNYTNSSRQTCENEDIPIGFPEYNTGVIGLRRSTAVRDFLNSWKKEFEHRPDLRPGDQPSFRSALYKSDLRIATLPQEYNCMFRYPGCVTGNIVVFHGRLMDINSEGASKRYSADRAQRELNQQKSTRAFAPRIFGGFKIITSPTKLYKLQHRYDEGGLTGVCRSVIKRLFPT